jgi:hypothetical protein
MAGRNAEEGNKKQRGDDGAALLVFLCRLMPTSA